MPTLSMGLGERMTNNKKVWEIREDISDGCLEAANEAIHLMRNFNFNIGLNNHRENRRCRKAGISRAPWVTATISMGRDVTR